MRLLILIASFWVLVASKPELYKEKEDFQYSRSSTDEGSKSGYYGAQRGNMGGNYERAHNMDSLAQHHMSTVVRNVEGELGEGANTRTGAVFSAANSRGLYGSGNYDVSNLRGRNFGESAISGDSLSQSALSQKSGYGRLYSAADKYSSSQAQNSGLSSGYQSSGLASQYLQTDAQKAADNIYHASNYNYGSEGANSYKYAQSSSQAQTDYENSNRASGYDHKARSNLVYTTPVRVYIKPGARIAIPVAAQVYDASAVQGQVHSDSEILDTTGQQLHYTPTSNAKHYESAYRYRKEWEKHNSIPVTVAPMENPIPTNSELYETANNNNQYESGLASAANSQSSSANSAYLSGYSASTKNALSSQSRHQSQKYDSGISASNAYNYGTSSSNAYKSGASDSNAYTLNGYDANLAANLSPSNNLIEDVGSKPKSYQSSYSYHKSWERRGDPYVIKPVGGDLSEQSSQRLTAKQGYACTYCLDESQQRVRRDIDFGQHSQNQWDTLGDKLEDIGQQTQSHWGKLEDLGQQSENQLSHNLENLHQQTQDKLEDFGQQTQSHWGKLEDLGQQAENQLSHNLENLGQQTQDKLEDFGQQTQSHWGKLEDLGQQSENQLSHNLENLDQQTQDKLEDFGQQTQSHWGKLEDLGQQAENQLSHNLENLGQQTQDKLEDFGQQTQSHWGKLEDLGQQSENQLSHNLDNLDQQTQDKLEDFGQQTQSHWGKLEDLGQQAENQLSHNLENLDQQTQDKLEDFGQQTQSHWGKLEDLSQQAENQLSHNLENLGQQTQDKLEDFGQQTQSHWGKLEDIGQQSENQLSHNLDNLDQQTQDKLEDFGQQTQSHWGKLEDLGQHAENQLSHNLGALSQQTQDKLEDIGQQTQSQWGKLEDLGQRGKNKLSHDLEDISQQTQDKLEDIGQQTHSHWDKLGDVGQQTLNQFGKQNQWELGHSNQHWTEQDHKNNWDNLGSLGHFSPGMQSHFGDIQNLEQSHFGQQNQNQWDKLGDLSQQTQPHWDNFGALGQRTQNQWDNNMGNLNRQTYSHFGNLGSLGKSHFGQQTQNQWDRLGDLNQQTQSHWGKLEDLGQQTQLDWNLGQQTQSVANFYQEINGYGGHHLNKPRTLDGSFIPYYTNYWELPESYYVQESLENINKMWNFHKNFEQGSYSHHHDFELKKSQDAHKTHNSDMSFNVNHINHPEKPKENTSVKNSERKLIPTIDKNVQNGTTTAKYFSLDDKTIKTTQKTVDDDEIHESFTLANIRPIDIGRGDIGPEDTLIETTDINEKKSYRTPEEIETLSLTKYQGDISEEPLKMSVTGLNQGSILGNKRKLGNELSTVIESVTISTAKSKENLENNNVHYIPVVYGSTPKSNFLSTSSIKAFNEKQNDEKQMRNNGEQDERRLSDTFEQPNWGQETQNFDEQKIKHLELFEQNVVQPLEAFKEKDIAQNFEPLEKQNKGQHLEPFEDQILVQQLEPLEKKKLRINLETVENPYFGQQLENFEQQNWEQQIQNFEQQNIVQNLEPFEQQLKPLENMEQLETNQNSVGQLHSFGQKNDRQLNIPEEQDILTNHFGQEAQTVAHRNILQNTETSSTGIETSPKNKYLQEQNEQKSQMVANSKNQDNMSTPIEPTTKSPGFWGSLYNKTKNAKDSLVSWFHNKLV